MSSELGSRTSEPPHASSWAAPPEFYVDENIVGRTLRREITALGYIVHTPGELFGTRDEAQGADDGEWMSRVAPHGWAVFGRDTKILTTPSELAAYQRSGLHMFLFPGEATRAQLVELLRRNLKAICTATSQRQPGVYRVTASGLQPMGHVTRHRHR